MPDLTPVTSLSTVDTIYSADSVEWCPGRPTLFAVGTYQIEKDPVKEDEVDETADELEKAKLEEDKDGEESDSEDDGEGSGGGMAGSGPGYKRYGRCLLYEVDRDGTNLREVQRFDGPAILDMKWSSQPINGKTTLAIADATGRVAWHTQDPDTFQLSHSQTLQVTDPETLCLSLDWNNRRQSAAPTSIVVSCSDGTISTLGGESEWAVTESWHTHDFEPWIAAFDCWEPNTVWTGGDDLKLKGWDLRQGCDTPTFVNKRFDGGVTTIQSHPLLENIFAVGSYDGHLRLFDRRKPLSPLTSIDCEGGLWRAKWHPSQTNRLLVAAMHPPGGCKVIHFDNLSAEGAFAEGEVSGEWAVRFDEHESMAYGADWSLGRGKGEGDVVASCSFYDHCLKMWSC